MVLKLSCCVFDKIYGIGALLGLSRLKQVGLARAWVPTVKQGLSEFRMYAMQGFSDVPDVHKNETVF